MSDILYLPDHLLVFTGSTFYVNLKIFLFVHMEAVVFLTFPGSGNLMVVLTLVEAGVITHAHIQIDKSHESSFC